MITVRPAKERGHFSHGWLDTWHTFSFDQYYDPRHMGFRSLRVINEDRVQPGRGFGMHGHRDMEILTYVLEGELAHRDSTGTGSAIRHGEVQRMSAGTGIRHSEFNHSQSQPVHLLQIWILPKQAGLEPGYEQKRIPEGEERNQLRLIAAPDARDGAVTIHQDARVYASLLDAGKTLTYEPAAGRHVWLQVARGTISVNDTRLAAGDGAAISDESTLNITGEADSTAEFLLFDLA